MLVVFVRFAVVLICTSSVMLKKVIMTNDTFGLMSTEIEKRGK